MNPHRSLKHPPCVGLSLKNAESPGLFSVVKTYAKAGFSALSEGFVGWISLAHPPRAARWMRDAYPPYGSMRILRTSYLFRTYANMPQQDKIPKTGHARRGALTPLGRFCVNAMVVVLAFALSVSAFSAEPSTELKAYDPRIIYTGHFDTQDSNGPRCNASACSVRLRFKGSELSVKLNESGSVVNDTVQANGWQVIIDRKPTAVIAAKPGQHTYTIASGLPAGEHEIELFRRTEGFLGTSQILGFTHNQGASIEAARPRTRRLEVIGDSISCGYGNEATSALEPFSPHTENAYMTYGAIAARAFGADYFVTCWTGMRAWQDSGGDKIFPLPAPPSSSPPDAVLINLGTNDFRDEIPDPTEWSHAYLNLVKRIRAYYPKTIIYLATSPMLSDDWPAGQRMHTTHKSYLNKIAKTLQSMGDENIRIVRFRTQTTQDGVGADWHPNLTTHQRMADLWIEALRYDLNWQ